MKSVWIVSEQSPGHDSQSRGLAGAMADLLPLTPYHAVGRTTARGWARPILTRWMGLTGRPLGDGLLRRVAQVQQPADAPPPDVILASGGKSVIPAVTWRRRFGAPLVYLGEQKDFPDAWFDLVVTPDPRADGPNTLQADLLPTPITPARVAEAAQGYTAQHAVPNGPLWLMVIGGASRSHRYADTDWIALARGMNALAGRHGIRWLVSTSRRTGAAAEQVIRAHLEPTHLADAVWWSQSPRKTLHAWLGLASAAFVTQDSVTMMSEAVAAGRPTVVARPAGVQWDAASFLPHYFDRLEANRRIVKLPMNQLADADPAPGRFDLVGDQPFHDLAERCIQRLGLNR